MTTKAEAEVTPFSRRRWARPLVIVFAAAGVLYFGPRLERHEIRFRLGPLGCAKEVSLDLFQEGQRLRGVRLPVAGQESLNYQAKLAPGEYLASLTLDCPMGVVTALEQPVVIDREGMIPLDPSARGCECPPRP